MRMMPVRTAVPVLALAAHKLRAGWRGWATLAVLVALASGAVLAAVAGAIRTDTAYPRFLAASNASDVLVAPAGPGMGGYDAAVAKLPGVAVAAEVVGINAVPVGAGGVLDNSATVVAPLDGRFGRTIEIPKMLAGRLPAASAPREIAVSQTGAQQLHLRVGSTLRMAALDNSTPPRARPLTERVVGVFVTAGSVLPVNYLDQVAQFMAPPALYRELGPDYWAFDGTYVKLSPGASLPVFSARAQALAKRYPATGGQAFVADQSVQAATVERAIRPQAVALALFALALALTALLVVGQVAARLVTEAAGDNTSLAALGMTRRQLIAVGLVEVTAAAVAGGAAAVIIAIAASPLTPIGPARLAEPSPGVSVDGPVLAVGFAVTVVLLLARVTVTAWRQAAARQAGAGGDADAARLAGGASPAPPVAGRRAPRRRGRAAAGRQRLAARARPRPRRDKRPGAQRAARPRGRGRRRGGRGHVRREPAPPRRHAQAVRAGLGHRVRRTVRHAYAQAVQPGHRERAGDLRRDVRRPRHRLD